MFDYKICLSSCDHSHILNTLHLLVLFHPPFQLHTNVQYSRDQRRVTSSRMDPTWGVKKVGFSIRLWMILACPSTRPLAIFTSEESFEKCLSKRHSCPSIYWLVLIRHRFMHDLGLFSKSCQPSKRGLWGAGGEVGIVPMKSPSDEALLIMPSPGCPF